MKSSSHLHFCLNILFQSKSSYKENNTEFKIMKNAYLLTSKIDVGGRDYYNPGDKCNSLSLLVKAY